MKCLDVRRWTLTLRLNLGVLGFEIRGFGVWKALKSPVRSKTYEKSARRWMILYKLHKLRTFDSSTIFSIISRIWCTVPLCILTINAYSFPCMQRVRFHFGSFTRPYPRSFLLQLNLGCHHRRLRLCLHHLLPSASTDSSRPAFGGTLGSLGRVGWECRGRVRLALCLHRYRRLRKCWMEQPRELQILHISLYFRMRPSELGWG